MNEKALARVKRWLPPLLAAAVAYLALRYLLPFFLPFLLAFAAALRVTDVGVFRDPPCQCYLIESIAHFVSSFFFFLC